MLKSLLMGLGLIAASCTSAVAQEVYLVNFTAEYCPSCKILDPRLDTASEHYPQDRMQRVVLDFTSPDTSQAAYDKVDGTLLANPYADFVGITGLGVLTAADSGETIECLTASMTADVMKIYIDAAVEIVRTRPVGQRGRDTMFCPAPNRGVRIN